jgi:hypothetical protein
LTQCIKISIIKTYMPFQDKTAQQSPFEITTSGKSKKMGKTGIIVSVSIVVFLILSIVAGVLLVRQQQNVQEKAAATCSEQCSGTLLKSCHPSDSDGTANESLCNLAGRVETCGPATTKYCCPSAGGVWTTDMTACATPTPTATATGTPTATPTSTPTPTPTGTANSCNKSCGSNSNCQSGLYCYSGYCRNPLCASDSTCGCGSATSTPTATATATGSTTTTTTQATSRPIPVTGTNWTTYAGVGVGVVAILVSLLLAL